MIEWRFHIKRKTKSNSKSFSFLIVEKMVLLYPGPDLARVLCGTLLLSKEKWCIYYRPNRKPEAVAYWSYLNVKDWRFVQSPPPSKHLLWALYWMKMWHYSKWFIKCFFFCARLLFIRLKFKFPIDVLWINSNCQKHTPSLGSQSYYHLFGKATFYSFF